MSIQSYQLSLLKIPVSNLETAAQFYEHDLGLTLEFLVEEYGWAQFSAGTLPLALYLPGKGGGDGQIGGSLDFHLSLAASDFDPLADRLLAAGVLVEDMMHTGADGSTFIDVRDPDGNVLKISRRA